MFVLAELKDNVRIAPDQFHLKLVDAVRDEIDRKLANKVRQSLRISGLVFTSRFFRAGFAQCGPVHCP